MLLILVLILLLIWAAVVWSIYSNFLVFYSNFSESENYHKAYYASISALERWELVTKQRNPWYVWSGGFRLWEPLGGNPDNNDWWSDGSLSWFSYLWDNAWESTVFRSVNSRTDRVPREWDWDVEWMLSANDSSNYDMMDYENAQVFLLYYDNSGGNPYDTWTIINSSVSRIRWQIRLPALMKTGFGNLDWYHPLGEWNNTAMDDAIVDWQIRWLYNGSPFTIYSTDWSDWLSVRSDRDTVFREHDISNPLGVLFQTSWDPISSSHISNRGNNAPLTSIAQEDFPTSIHGFDELFTNPRTNKLQLRFGLLNLLKWNNDDDSIYPFLEYYADFWTAVSDKYYKIEAEWNYKDYKVDTTIYKPTVKETVLWSFTTIF